jgi:hypothetical protein
MRAIADMLVGDWSHREPRMGIAVRSCGASPYPLGGSFHSGHGLK